jgi:hypothetical protein
LKEQEGLLELRTGQREVTPPPGCRPKQIADLCHPLCVSQFLEEGQTFLTHGFHPFPIVQVERQLCGGREGSGSYSATGSLTCRQGQFQESLSLPCIATQVPEPEQGAPQAQRLLSLLLISLLLSLLYQKAERCPQVFTFLL